MNIQDRTIALTFSGGGFRAAGFSLGTMVLLKRIGLMEKVQAISSASGGSITAAFFLAAKAHFYSDHKNENDSFEMSDFMDKFYHPLKKFLESDIVANAILSDLGGEEKMIKKAANCYQKQLQEILENSENTMMINQIWELLTKTDISPDCLSINATNMTDASLFRFAMLRTQTANKGLVIGNTFIDVSDANSSNSEMMECCHQLRLGDMIAASSCFPIGFEPIIFPDDFYREGCLKEVLKNQKNVALMDAGLYDNLALTSIESLRPNFENYNQEPKITLRYPINLVIATDADNLEPSSALLDPDQLNKGNDPNALFDQLPHFVNLLVTLFDSIFKQFNLYSKLVNWLVSKVSIKEVDDSTSQSWRSLDKNKLAKLIPNRLKELSPTFGAFLKRNRNLTYQFLQYKYEQENKNHEQENEKINLIRNLIFDLYNRNDPDTALSELVPKLTELSQESLIDNSESSPKSDSEAILREMRKINTLVLALMSSQNSASDANYQIETFTNEESNLKNLICLAKLATALPTTLWLKWYTICSVESKEKSSQSDSLIDEILKDESTCVWKTDSTTGSFMTFATEAGDFQKTTAAEVVIACGFVAACYNLLEYSANKIGVLYSNSNNSDDSEETILKKLSQLSHYRNNLETLNNFGDKFRNELEKLGLKEVEDAASIWWQIMSISSPNSNLSGEKILHHLIKQIIQMATTEISK